MNRFIITLFSERFNDLFAVKFNDDRAYLISGFILFILNPPNKGKF